MRLGTSSAWRTGRPLEVGAVSWADRDGDGDLDLAVVRSARSNRVAYGTRPQVWDADRGSLSIGWTSPHDVASSAVAWGDRDGDGDADLAIGAEATGPEAPDRVLDNTGSDLVSWWEAWDPDAPTGTAQTADLAWADADGDGDLDLAQARYDGEGTAVWRNTGAGLELGWTVPQARATFAVAWADIDGDGDADLAEGNSGARSRIWRNDGSFVFAEVFSGGAGLDTRDVAFGDFDADGDPDLVLVDGSSRTRVLRNDNGAFLPFWTAPVGEQSRRAAWGDWDGDGDLDLALANHRSPVRVYEYRNGTFTQGWQAPVAEPSTDVAWADWDGDGDLDLTVANDHAPLRIYANGSSAARLVVLPPDQEEAGTDLAFRVIGAMPGATVELYAADLRGRDPAPGCAGVQLGLGGATLRGTVTANADGEGVVRIVAPPWTMGQRLHLQALEPSTCVAGPVSFVDLPFRLRAEDVARTSFHDEWDGPGRAVAGVEDQDGDGEPEVLVGHPDGSRVLWFGAGDGVVDPARVSTLDGTSPLDLTGSPIRARDVDQDGISEVLVSAVVGAGQDRDAGRVYLLRGPLWSGSLANASATLLGEARWDYAGGAVALSTDLTGDGTWDVVVGAERALGDSGRVYVVNAGASLNGRVPLGSATAEIQPAVQDGGRLGALVAADDLDGDGLADLLTSDHGGLQLFHGPLAGVVDPSAADRAWFGGVHFASGNDLVIADLDGDGDADAANGSVRRAVDVIDGDAASAPMEQAAHVTLEADLGYSGFGWSMAAGDLDGDGAQDLVVGDYLGPNARNEYQAGRVAVYYGPLAAGTRSWRTADLVYDGDSVVLSADGDSYLSGDWLGSSVAVLPDSDGDGRCDLVLGGENGSIALVVPTF